MATKYNKTEESMIDKGRTLWRIVEISTGQKGDGLSMYAI